LLLPVVVVVVVVVAALWLFCALKALHLHRNGQSVCANSSKPTSATPATATSTTTQLFNIIKYFALSGMHTNAFYMSIAVSVCVF